MLKFNNFLKNIWKQRGATKAESNSTIWRINNFEAWSTKEATVKTTFKVEPKNKKNKKSKMMAKNHKNKLMDNKNQSLWISLHGNEKMVSAPIKKSL